MPRSTVLCDPQHTDSAPDPDQFNAVLAKLVEALVNPDTARRQAAVREALQIPGQVVMMLVADRLTNYLDGDDEHFAGAIASLTDFGPPVLQPLIWRFSSERTVAAQLAITDVLFEIGCGLVDDDRCPLLFDMKMLQRLHGADLCVASAMQNAIRRLEQAPAARSPIVLLVGPVRIASPPARPLLMLSHLEDCRTAI